MATKQIIDEKEMAQILELISGGPSVSLKDISKKFHSDYGKSKMNACCGLALLIDYNLLSQRQRYAAIYILIVEFGTDLNPFFPIFSTLLRKTNLQFERKFICELLLDLDINKWDKMTLDNLIMEQCTMTSIYTIPDAVTNLETLFIKDQEQIEKCTTSISMINRVVPDFDLIDDENGIPSMNFTGNDLTPYDLELADFRPKLLTPLPSEISVRESEFKLIVPLVVDDVMWIQNDAQKEATIGLVLDLVKTAGQKNLSSKQTTYTLEILENNLDVLEKDNVLIDNLEKILEHNATLVSSLIIILADKKVDFFKKCLTKFVSFPLDINSLEVIYRTIQNVMVPQSFLDLYIYQWFEGCKHLENDPTSQNKKLKLITKFATNLLEKGLFDPIEKYEHWVGFCSEFENHKCAQDFHIILQKGYKGRNSEKGKV